MTGAEIKRMGTGTDPKRSEEIARSGIDERWYEANYAQMVRIKGRLAATFVKFWSSSLHIEKYGWENNESAKSMRKPILYLCWHGSQLVPLSCYRNRGIYVLTSLSRDGDIQTQSMACLGFKTVRGSSSRGGSRALLEMIRSMKSGHDAAIVVDGPKGPYHVAKPGAVLLAQRTGASVIPVGADYARCIKLNNWDRFEIPLPFSRVVVVTGSPFTISPELSLEDGARLIEGKISECDRLAAQKVSR